MSSHIFLWVFRETCKSEPMTREIQMPWVSGRNRFTARKSLWPFASFFLYKSLLGVLEAEDRQAIPRQQQETCSQHTKEGVRYYCISCEACIYEDHRGHAFDLLEKAVQEDKKNISTVETIKEKADLFRAELRKLEKTSEHVEMIIAIAKQEVSRQLNTWSQDATAWKTAFRDLRRDE